MTRIGYCLLVHKNPRQVGRLIKNIYSPSDFFYVNIFGNESVRENWEKELKQYEGDNFSKVFRYGSSWGAFPLVGAQLDSMKTFDRFDYDYFINLSGQCYPLKSIDCIRKFFQNKNSAYIETHKMPYPYLGLGRIRYSYYRNPFFAFGDVVLKKILGSRKYETRRFIKHGQFIRIPRIKKHMPYNFEPYGGQTWFCLNKRHVDYILQCFRDKPDLLKFFRRIFAPDEFLFQTIIMNSPLRDTVVNDHLRYIDWTKKGVPLPALLTIDDKNRLLSSSKLFARKFDIELDECILDQIDSHKKLCP